MLSTNKNNFTSPLPTQMHFIQFLLHIVQTKISSTMLNKSDEDTHSCFVFYLGRKTLSSTTKYWGHYILFFFWSYILFVNVFFQVKDIFFSLRFDESFYPEWIMDFAKYFFSIEIITSFLFVFPFSISQHSKLYRLL